MSWLRYLVLLLVGIVLGWELKSLSNQEPKDEELRDNIPLAAQPSFATPREATILFNDTDTLSVDATHLSVDLDARRPKPGAVKQVQDASIEQDKSEFVSQFKTLLKQKKYEQAMLVFQAAENSIHVGTKDLRSILLKHLSSLLEKDHSRDFVALTNSYLSIYFEDIDVLLLLANFNKGENFYTEAIGVYQLADEYAYVLKSKKKIEREFSEFLEDVDSYLSQQSDWYSLGQLYFQAQIAGLLKPRHRLRQAELYLISGETYEARRILNALLDDQSVSNDARILLSEIEGNRDIPARARRFNDRSSAIALEKRGNQYIANLGLSGKSTVRLLIDTGASLTTLSRESFNRVQSRLSYSYLGDRMFSTANGLVKGEVYTLDTVQIAGYTLENSMVAVLDFGMGHNVDGLLGMNVLGKFRFQIEQDQNKLLLSPRESSVQSR